MATYVVTTHADDDFASEDGGQYKTKPPAVAQFQMLADAGAFARLVVWNDHQSTELQRANDPPSQDQA